MMITILSIVLTLIFTFLGGIHFYWLLGGDWGVNKVIPTKSKTTPVFETPQIATLMVGLVLLSFALIYLLKLQLFTLPFSDWFIHYTYWVIPTIFILRAIGEFKYVGFFKKIKDTEFAKADSKLFSPLCFAIGVAGVLIQIV